MKTVVLGMNNGLMVYWEEVKEAAQYYVHLLISDRNRRQKSKMVKRVGLKTKKNSRDSSRCS